MPLSNKVTVPCTWLYIHIYNISYNVLYSPGVSPPSGVTAVQTGPTSIDVSWTPPSPLGDTTGYIIYYTNDDNTDGDSVVVSSGSTDQYTLTNLQNGDTYIIFIVATSENFRSYIVPADMNIGLCELNINNIQ